MNRHNICSSVFSNSIKLLQKRGLVDISVYKDIANTFGGVEHRIEFVREFDGVKYYNDSIATSPSRVISGLRAFGKKIIVIMGGSDAK